MSETKPQSPTTETPRERHAREWRQSLGVIDASVLPTWKADAATQDELRANASYCFWLACGKCDDLGQFILTNKAIEYLRRADDVAWETANVTGE